MNVPSDIFTYLPSTTSAAAWTYLSPDGVASAFAPAGATAKFEKSILTGPGVTVEVRTMARRTAGVGGAVAIDYLPIGRGGGQVNIESSEWREYVTSFTTPLNSPENLRTTLAVGNFSAYGEGAIDFLTPRISIFNTDLGAPRILARGLIMVSQGVASVNPNFAADGIKSVSYSPANAAVTVKMRGNNGAGLRLHPIMTASITDDNERADAMRLLAKVGRYDRDTGEAPITFIDASTGLKKDVSTINGAIYVAFTAEI